MRRQTMNSKIRALLATAVATVGSLVFLVSPASAIYSHNDLEATMNIGSCGGGEASIYDIAVDETNGWIYASCFQPYPAGWQIKRFDLNGAPADFSVVEPYIEGNTITYDPGGEEEKFATALQIEVDNSNSINQGRLFAASSPNVDIFKPNGEFAGPIAQPLESGISNYLTGLDVGPDGSIYVGSEKPGARISKYTPALNEVKRLYSSSPSEGPYSYRPPCVTKVDTTGAIWVAHCGFLGGGNYEFDKYEADQFTTELSFAPFGTTTEQIIPFMAKPSPYEATSPAFTTSASQYDVDLNTNDLYVDEHNQIVTYSQGTASEPAHRNSPAFGSPAIGSSSRAIAVTKDNKVYVSKGGETILRFGPGDIIPDIHNSAAAIDDIGHTTAIVKGVVDRAGGTKIVSCEFKYGFGPKYNGPGSGSKPCTSAGPLPYEGASTPVEAELTELTTGSTYHYGLFATNEKGENFGIDRTVIPAFVLKVQTLPVEEIDTDGAVLKGSFDPDNKATEYWFEYGIDGSYGLKTSVTTGVTGTGVTTVGKELNNLPSGKTFHYRLVAKNAEGTTFGVDRTFRTGSPPDISGVRATEIAETSATLKAAINPVGFETKYQIEYGINPEYDHSVPASLTSIGSGEEKVNVSHSVTGLLAGFTYHFRVVAENKWGTAYSPDTTFDYAPPACPNDHVRQQSGASYLPDCRAYELVSPEAAGAVLLLPTNAVAKLGEGLQETGVNNNNAYDQGLDYVVNRGFAASPSRFSFYGSVGTVTGINAPTSESDMYMSTRTPSGWVTSLAGLNGDEAFETSRAECSENMALCTDHLESRNGNVAFGYQREYAPYLYTASGERLGRLPTNLDVIPNGAQFHGWQRMSGDFSHFVFSSSDWIGPYPEQKHFSGIPFAPGGLTEGVGSAYDNDIADRTVKLISRLPGGEDIPTFDPSFKQSQAISFPGLSPNGSHILMAAFGGVGKRFLYMSINDGPVMLIGKKETADPQTEPEVQVPVEPIGMNRSGSEVFFSSTEQLTLDDTDSSRDIYMWSEATEKLTRISQGNGQGDSDECSAGWTSGCNAQVVTPERMHPNENQGTSVPTAQDDQFAENTGDLFFYSPELLDPTRPGIQNQKNLYDFRNGAPRLVATLEPGAEINRLQISPDGKHAAFLTKSNLTSYDSKGFKEMYTYNAETGEIQCASCNPSGAAPVGEARASEGGRFMADDGRTFFSTYDALVPRDQDGKLTDVYEYVAGRPQLITSGLASRDYTGGSTVVNLLSSNEYTGLEAVDHDGTDVYFSTFETLVGRDHNGAFVKFYDARSGGGFDESPPLGPCAAADECHGTDSSPPAPATIASGATVPGGNVTPQKRKKHHKKTKRHHKRHGKRHHHG